MTGEPTEKATTSDGRTADGRAYEDLRRIAVAVAEAAAVHVRLRRPEVFAQPTGYDDGAAASSVTAKSTPTDPVTIVDTESERIVRDELARRAPGDPILGEEDGGTIEAPESVRWVVDPIDGTVNFLYGLGGHAVSVAAQVGGVSVAGAVVDVPGAITYSAARGGGAWAAPSGAAGDAGRRRLRVNPVRDLGRALVGTGFGYAPDRRRLQGGFLAALLPRVRDIRRLGSAALDLCHVASGALDAHYEHGLSPWDWAAGTLVAEEAGAVVGLPDPSSRSAGGDLTVVAAPGVADALRGLLDEIGASAPLA